MNLTGSPIFSPPLDRDFLWGRQTAGFSLYSRRILHYYLEFPGPCNMHVLTLSDLLLGLSTWLILKLQSWTFSGLVGGVYPTNFTPNMTVIVVICLVLVIFIRCPTFVNLFWSLYAFKNIVGLPVGTRSEVPDLQIILF